MVPIIIGSKWRNYFAANDESITREREGEREREREKPRNLIPKKNG